MKIKSLEDLYESTKDKNPGLGAEAAYALAIIHLQKAQEAGRACLNLLDKTKRDTLEECAPTLVTVSGVPIPDIFHAEVAKRNLSSLNL